MKFQQGALLYVQMDDWFTAPDGNQYRSVWGKVTLVRAEDLMGFKPAHGTNWYLQVGDGEGSLIIAGCKVHFAMPTSKRPTFRDCLNLYP